jgi:hypothetical protein
MHGPRRIDTAWPQTQVMRRQRVVQTRPWIDWRDPIEAGAAVCAGIGFAVLAAMWAGVVS